MTQWALFLTRFHRATRGVAAVALLGITQAQDSPDGEAAFLDKVRQLTFAGKRAGKAISVPTAAS